MHGRVKRLLDTIHERIVEAFPPQEPPARPAKILSRETALVGHVDKLIGLLSARGYGDRDRLLRKLMEEVGEYCEAIEYANGATRKIEKFDGIDPQAKLKEEISDVVMVALALARIDGHLTADILEVIKEKLGWREAEYQESIKEDDE